MSAPRIPLPAPVAGLLNSPRFTHALAWTILVTAFSTHAIRAVLDWPGLLGILGTLVVLAAAGILAHRGMIEWQGLLPISLIVFVAWCGVSIFWSYYRWATLAGFAYQVAFAFLAVYIALVRDSIQLVRLVGDVLRLLLAVSLALEVLSGLVLRLPIDFLGIRGDIAYGGPIQGIFESRNQLGYAAVIALVTFLVEWRTHSVPRGRAGLSVALAVVCAFLSRSPVVLAILVVVLLATLALAGLRRVRSAEHRMLWQGGLGLLVLVGAIAAYLARYWIIGLFGAGGMLQVRYSVWVQMWRLMPEHTVQGWGWVGAWRDLPPFSVIDLLTGGWHENGLNAFLDVYLQVGLVGLAAFVVLVALAFGRSWLLASNRRSTIFVWPPLILVALTAISAAESLVLVESVWLLLVVCIVKASQNLSWRNALPPREPTLPSP